MHVDESIQVLQSKSPSPWVVPGGYDNGNNDDGDNNNINLKLH